VSEEELAELLPLVRAYCDFYEVSPSDVDLLELSRALLADPDREGVQLIARDDSGAVVGFATVFWSWNTLLAARIGVMNDLFVAPAARGTGIADELIRACAEQARQHGAHSLDWETAKDNERAQRVYDRIGATRSEWVDYSLPVTPGSS
jgi:ribosomal protein S18 acetylase RimI-like enzyme